MVEPAAVNRVVVGSSPTRGARIFRPAFSRVFLYTDEPPQSLPCDHGSRGPRPPGQVRKAPLGAQGSQGAKRTRSRIDLAVLEVILELAGAAGVTKFGQGLGLDLANALTRDAKLAANFLKSARMALSLIHI